VSILLHGNEEEERGLRAIQTLLAFDNNAPLLIRIMLTDEFI